MKIEIPIKKLKDIVTLASSITEKHPTLPVLSAIVVDVTKNVATFKATNLDVGIEITTPVKSDGEGTVAIPAGIITSFLSQVYDQNQIAVLEIVSGNLNITIGKSKGLVKTVPSEDFPTIPRASDAEEISISRDIFIKGLKSVWYSASVSSVKPELSSVYVYRDTDTLVFAATDSFRLAEKRIRAPLAEKIQDILIPFRNIPNIIRFLESAGEMVNVRATKNIISFESKDMYAVSRIIDGVFPDYKQIIPKSFVTEAVVLKQDFLNSLKISNIFSDKFNQVHLTIDPKNKLMEVHTKNSDIGENNTAIDAALTGDRMEINFNYKYIVDCFQSIDADSLSLQLSGANRPMVIRPVSGDQTFMYLVMPMNR